MTNQSAGHIAGYIGTATGGSQVNVLSNRRALNTPGRSGQDRAAYSTNLQEGSLLTEFYTAVLYRIRCRWQ